MAGWVSWIHVDDFLMAVRWIIGSPQVDGVVHVTAPHPIRNADMMAELRRQLRRPWSPPTPAPLVRLGARLMRTDPALALTGRRCVPRRMLDAEVEFRHPDFAGALTDLLAQRR